MRTVWAGQGQIALYAAPDLGDDVGMALDLAALPDDLNALRAIVAAQATELAAKNSLIGSLRLQLARLRRMQFGRSSERLQGSIEQLELALEELEAEEAGAGPGPGAFIAAHPGFPQ